MSVYGRILRKLNHELLWVVPELPEEDISNMLVLYSTINCHGLFELPEKDISNVVVEYFLH